ncbi:hypothetical protein [Sphingobacterium multivorum]|uniref:hypothetical protein n=1 Tax=Sphingobacterium multivorum TaxID=28454 RepID=UPI003DA3CFAF
MKDALFIIICLLIIQQLQAQTIRDSVFNDVILINEKDVTTDGKDFLIDTPFKSQKEPIVIFNNDRRIPLELFCKHNSFLGGQNEIILITPDWEYQKEIVEEQKRKGIHIKPSSQNKFYHIKRNNTETKVDSLSVRMDNPRKAITINFKKTELQKNELKFYFSNLEMPEYTTDEKAELDKLNYQLQVNVFEGIYRDYTQIARIKTIKGEEERHPASYSLSSLPIEKKLPAIKAMVKILGISFNNTPKIYLPYTVIKKR